MDQFSFYKSVVWKDLLSHNSIHLYRVGQINVHKFQMVANTCTKRNDNICFIRVIAYIHSSQDIVMFDKSTKIIECSKQKEMPLLKYAARATLLPT